MKMSFHLPADHPLNRVHRVGAALFGAGLVIFGILGFANRLAFLSVVGEPVLGMRSNGLLSMISVVVGLILVGASIRGGRVASTTTSVIGGLFLLSGLANLAVLDTELNLFAFEISNVMFSMIAGMLLLFLGVYGRVSGGLPDDNPYVQARHGGHPLTAEEVAAERRRLADIDELSRAELAFAEGHASPEQELIVRADAAARAAEAYRSAYRRSVDEHPQT
ncbi:MAG: DUF4383 domain-containing protein [Pseudonocardiaceae bacterium]